MQTCHVRPQLTEQLLLEGKLDDTRIEALALRGAPEREGPHHFKWSTRLYTGLFWWRATVLHVSSTPSSNLTILELVPKRHWKRGTRRFIKRGVRSVEALASRIESLASSLPSSASGQPRDQ